MDKKDILEVNKMTKRKDNLFLFGVFICIVICIAGLALMILQALPIYSEEQVCGQVYHAEKVTRTTGGRGSRKSEYIVFSLLENPERKYVYRYKEGIKVGDNVCIKFIKISNANYKIEIMPS